MVPLALTRDAQGGLAGRAVKRTLDITVSAALLLFTLPIGATAALAVWAADGGPVFSRHPRIGLGGRPFSLLKFRTVPLDRGADQDAKPRDPQPSTVGGFLHRSRIEELPQLLNVLRGEMSLVGPHPEHPTTARRLQERIPNYTGRQLVLPGLTGWAQLTKPAGSSFADAVEATSCDLYYVKNASLRLDLAILARTLRAVFADQKSR